jgi:hypothetical protein
MSPPQPTSRGRTSAEAVATPCIDDTHAGDPRQDSEVAYNPAVRWLPICCFLLLLPLTAAAAPTVLYGPTLDAASAANRASAYLDSGDFRVAGPASDLVVGADMELVAQGIELQRCPAETGALGPVVGVARIQILEMEYASATGALEGAAKGLPCGARDATREDIFELFFLQGLAAFNDGREDDARAAFSAAAAVSVSQPWPSNHPPTAKALYLESLQGALSSKTTVVDTDLTDLLLDGEVAENQRGVNLLAGRHLLRHGDDVALATATTDGGSARMTTAGTLRSWLDNGADEAGPWLAEMARAREWDRVVLLLGDRVLELTGEQLLEQERVEPKAKLPTGAAVGISMIGVGAGTFGVGLTANLETANEARELEKNVREGTVEDGVDPNEAYAEALRLNRIGLGLSLAGVGVAVAGGVITAATLLTPKVSVVSAAPWVAPGADGGVVLGVAGRF